MVSQRVFVATLLLLLAWLPGCGDASSTGSANPQDKSQKPIKVTATVGMVADLVREIGGQRVQVNQLLGAGVDPHLYKPTRDDVQAIIGSDIVFYNGLMLEGKMAETLQRFSKTKPTFPVAQNLTLPTELAAHQDSHHPDPHVWMDVSLWTQAASVVEHELSQFDAAHADEYAARATTLRNRLSALHSYGQKVMQGIPPDRRVLITSHDAFRYFGHAYGLEVQAVQGISTESEAGLKRINELVDLLVERKVEAVFIESSVPKESIESLLHGAQARGQTVKIGGELYSDAMGSDGTYEGTYLGMMDHNLTTIAKALGSSSVPEGGFRGSEAQGTIQP